VGRAGVRPQDGPEPSLRLPRQRGGVRGDLRPGAGQGAPYGSGPYTHTDGQLYTRRGGRGFNFEDPYGHLLEVMTMPETGSQQATAGVCVTNLRLQVSRGLISRCMI
jgi:hypothetical protein